MPSKELIEKVASHFEFPDKETTLVTAENILNEILAALQEPTEEMIEAVEYRRDTPFDQYFKDAEDVDMWAAMWWKQMLLASPLGEEK